MAVSQLSPYVETVHEGMRSQIHSNILIQLLSMSIYANK